MPSKYDTNPLDPEFPEKARIRQEEQETRTLPYTAAPTRQFTSPAPGEEQTRRFDAGFPGATAPVYAPPGDAAMGAINRKVAKVGLPENVLIAMPYIPWYIGMVAGILILLFVPRSEAKVRFHAAQGLAAHIGILVISSILGLILGNFVPMASAGNAVFNIVTMVMLIVFAFKAWKGRPVHIESVESLTNWLEEKINPRP